MSKVTKAAKDTRSPIAILNMQIITIVKEPIFSGCYTIGQIVDDQLKMARSNGDQINEINLILDPVSVNNIWLDMSDHGKLNSDD